MFKLNADRALWTNQQRGDLGEALAQVAFLRRGCYVYTRKRDDHGIDFMAETPDGKIVAVQVKTLTVLPGKSNPHVLIKKSKLRIAEDMVIAVVLLGETGEDIFLVPSTVFFDSPRGDLFSQWHNVGHRLEPEWQIKVGVKARSLLEQYRF